MLFRHLELGARDVRQIYCEVVANHESLDLACMGTEASTVIDPYDFDLCYGRS